MSVEPKGRKIDGEPPPRSSFIRPPKRRVIETTSNVNLKLIQDRNLAVAQAQQDGCTGNFRIFDSPVGNFLVPVIPTPAELDGSNKTCRPSSKGDEIWESELIFT